MLAVAGLVDLPEVFGHHWPSFEGLTHRLPRVFRKISDGWKLWKSYQSSISDGKNICYHNPCLHIKVFWRASFYWLVFFVRFHSIRFQLSILNLGGEEQGLRFVPHVKMVKKMLKHIIFVFTTGVILYGMCLNFICPLPFRRVWWARRNTFSVLIGLT